MIVNDLRSAENGACLFLSDFAFCRWVLARPARQVILVFLYVLVVGAGSMIGSSTHRVNPSFPFTIVRSAANASTTSSAKK